MKFILLLVVAWCTSGAAHASDAGRFLCRCDVSSAVGTPGLGGGVAAEDVIAWMAPRSAMIEAALKHVGFQPGDRVTICDGSSCLDLVIVAGAASSGWVVAPKGKYPDDGHGYKNAGVGRIGGSTSAYYVSHTDMNLIQMTTPQTSHWTITTYNCNPFCTPIPGTTNEFRSGFGSSFDWFGDTNGSNYASSDYSGSAGYNSHGTADREYYGGIGVNVGSGYGGFFAPGDSVNVGNGGLIPQNVHTNNR